MSIDQIIGIASLLVGIIGVVVGVIGCMSLTKANKLKVEQINNSTINQAETLIVNNGMDSYAVIKLAKETTRDELKGIVNSLEATTLDLEGLKRQIEAMPKIYYGIGPPTQIAREGDIYFQLDEKELLDGEIDNICT